jgi:hypothetical protein
MNYQVDTRKQGRKIMDIKYTVRAGSDFVGEQKAANKRGRDDNLRALNAGVDLAPKTSRGRR